MCVYVLTHMNTLTAIIVRILNFTLLICVQCLLAIGIISSIQQPDPDHPCVCGGGVGFYWSVYSSLFLGMASPVLAVSTL